MKNTIFLLLISTAFLYKSAVGSLDFQDCGSNSRVSNLTIEGCISDDVDCVFIIGTNIKVSFEIAKLSLFTETLENDVNFLWRGVNWPLTVSPDPCTAMTCPIQVLKGKETYHATLSVGPLFQPMNGDLKWIMRGDGGVQILCILKRSVFIKY